jgi:hypothetical protein
VRVLLFSQGCPTHNFILGDGAPKLAKCYQNHKSSFGENRNFAFRSPRTTLRLQCLCSVGIVPGLNSDTNYKQNPSSRSVAGDITYVRTYEYIHTCMHVCIHACIHIHTHTEGSSNQSHSTEPFLDTASRLFTYKFFSNLCNPKILHPVHMSPAPVPILSQINSGHAMPLHRIQDPV